MKEGNWHFRLNENLMGKTHTINLSLMVEEEEVDPEYLQNLRELTQIVNELYKTKDKRLINMGNEIIKKQKLPR